LDILPMAAYNPITGMRRLVHFTHFQHRPSIAIILDGHDPGMVYPENAGLDHAARNPLDGEREL